MSTLSTPRSVIATLMQPLGSALSAVVAFGVLLVATRDGQFASIASFAAGGAVAAIASVLAGGGTTLAYTTGDETRQAAVRLVRIYVVLPTVLLSTMGAALVYSQFGSLDILSVAAGGLSVAASVGAELDASYLRRQLRTSSLFVADMTNRLIALTAILLGAKFAIAMLLGALTRHTILRVLSAKDTSRGRLRLINKGVLSLAYEARLTSLSILYAVSDRLSALVAPMAAPVPVAGAYMASVTAQQSASGVLMTGIQTTLAARAQQKKQLAWATRLDLGIVAFAFATGGALIVYQEWVWGILGITNDLSPEDYWPAIMLLIPASLSSRFLEFRFLSQGASGRAVASRTVATCVAILSAVTAAMHASVSILAVGLVVAEAAGVFTACTMMTIGISRTHRKQ